jgi:hypothetical protein
MHAVPVSRRQSQPFSSLDSPRQYGAAKNFVPFCGEVSLKQVEADVSRPAFATVQANQQPNAKPIHNPTTNKGGRTMLRKFALAGVLALSVHLAQPVARLGSEAAAQFVTPTDYYIARALLIADRYERVASMAAQRGDIFTVALAYRQMAIELSWLPTWGVDPDVVRVTYKVAGLAFSYGNAVLELNNPWLHDHWKAMRLLELAARMADLENEIRQAQLRAVLRASSGPFD